VTMGEFNERVLRVIYPDTFDRAERSGQTGHGSSRAVYEVVCNHLGIDADLLATTMRPPEAT